MKGKLAGMIGAAVLAAAALGGGSATAAQDEAPPQGQNGASNGAEHEPPDGLRPGDVVSDHGVSVIVPRPGFGVGTEAIFHDGSVEELHVETAADGSVAVNEWGSERQTQSDGGPLSSDYGCSQTGYVHASHRWYQTYNWYLKDTAPSGLTISSTEQAVRASVAAITNAKNDCGIGDNVTASHNFQARTSRGINITSSGSCGTFDNYNVVGFGPLPDSYLGVACWWYQDTGKAWKEAVEADSKLNSSYYYWRVGTASLTCELDNPQRWGVENVMTHEAGHIFGMGHPSETTDGDQTMSPYAEAPCDDRESTLGKGDVTGLDTKY